MSSRRRRGLGYVAGFLALLGGYTAVYRWGMATFEGQRITYPQALIFVVETMTTIGYGGTATWTTLPMTLIVVGMMITGVGFIFMAVPLFVVPWLDERLSTTVPESVDLSGHVVVCAFTGRSESLVEELESLEVPAVVVEPDGETATERYEAGYRVIEGDPEDPETLERANLFAARGLVCDVDDEVNASIALAAGDVAPDVPVYTFVSDPDAATYHRYAGAETVFSPRQLIGERLASKVTAGLSDDVDDAVEIAEDFEILEFPVPPGSDLAGRTVAESEIRERTGAQIVGAWFQGEFVAPPPPSATIDDRTVLLVAGRESQLEALKQLTRTDARSRKRGEVIVCGYGMVGSTVAEAVSEAGLDCCTVDVADGPGVDVVGDATDPDTLRAAGIDDASTVYLTLPEDTLAVYATLVLRELAPDVEIIARANDTDNVGKLYRAGADYVLALSTVSGRMVAAHVLGEEVVAYDQQVDVVRVPADGFAGRSIEATAIRERYDCTIVAIERDGAVLSDLDPGLDIESGDVLIVTGPDHGLNRLVVEHGD